MPLLTRPGAPALHYEITDFTDPWSDSPYLFLQHGYGRSGAFWYQWVPALSRHFKVVCPDLRGCGRSLADFDLASGYTLESLSDDVIAIADALDIDSFHYCGESIGGLIGLAVAARHPARIRSLVNISGPVFISEGAKRGNALGCASWAAAIRELGPRTWVERTNGMRFPPDTPEGFLHWYTDTVEQTGAAVLAAIAQFALDADARPYLPRIEAPLLCLYPKQGVVANDEQQRTLLDLVPNIELRQVSTTYHMVQNIVPDECLTLVRSHIAKAEVRGSGLGANFDN